MSEKSPKPKRGPYRKGRKPGSGNKPRTSLTPQEVDFLSRYILTGSLKRSAIEAGLTVGGYLHKILNKPHAVKFLEEKRKEYEDNKFAALMKAYEVTLDFVDEKAATLLTTMATHEYRGDSDKVKLIENLYKRLGQISAPKIVQNNETHQANAVAVAATALPEGRPYLYVPPWQKALREASTINLPAEDAQ